MSIREALNERQAVSGAVAVVVLLLAAEWLLRKKMGLA